MECLSREVVVSLIEQILIYEKKEGEHYPRIEIHFKYAEEFQTSLSLVEELHLDSDILTADKNHCFQKKGKEGTYGKDE